MAEPNDSKSRCLTDEEIIGLNSGLMTPLKIDAAFEHIAECHKCESILLSQQDTNFVSSIRFAVRQWNSKRELSDTDQPSIDETVDTSARRRPSDVAIATDPDETRALPGRLGKYRIINLIAEGGFGRVYKGFDEILKRHVAIKVPRSDRFDSAQEKDAFLREAQLIASVAHQNIVPVYEADKNSDGTLFIAMKWVEGKDLRFVDLEQMPISERFRLMEKICRAVDFAHSKGILHRDLKPANILIDDNGEPLITDFGLAIDQKNDPLPEDSIAGTLSYMAPEQLRGQLDRVDFRADIWSLGVIFYEIISGNKPFAGRELSIVARINEGTPEQIQATTESTPLIQSIIDGALEKDPEQRIASAEKMADQLAEARRKLTGESTLATAAKGLTGVGISLIAIILVLITTMMMLPGNDDRGEKTQEQLADEWGIEKLRYNEEDDHFVIEGETLTLRTPTLALLGTGETDTPDYDLTFEFGQTPWSGGIGFFFGHQDDHFHSLDVRRASTGYMNLTYAINYEVPGSIYSPHSQEASTRNNMIEHGADDTFEVTVQVRGNRIHAFLFKGEKLEFQPNSHMMELPPAYHDCVGKFGYLGFVGTGYFYKHDIQFLED